MKGGEWRKEKEKGQEMECLEERGKGGEKIENGRQNKWNVV